MAPILAVVGAGWLLAPRRLRWYRAVRRRLSARAWRRREAGAVALVCSRVARRLVVGESLVVALEGAAAGTPLETSMARALGEHRRGLALDKVADRWVGRDDSFEVGLLAAAIRLSGGGVGARPELFDHVALTLRRRAELRADARAHASQARASSWVVVALPWVVAGGIAVGGGEPARVLFRSPLGWWCLAGAIALEAAGLAWMRWLIGRAAR